MVPIFQVCSPSVNSHCRCKVGELSDKGFETLGEALDMYSDFLSMREGLKLRNATGRS